MKFGIFLKKDLDTAIKLYQIAAGLGEKTAKSNLEKLNKSWTQVSSKKNAAFDKGFLGISGISLQPFATGLKK